MDKPVKATGLPRIEFFQFAALRSLSVLDEQRQGLLRRKKVDPFEALYLGEVGTVGESFSLLTQPYFLPASYFGPYFQDFAGNKFIPEGGPSKFLVAGANGERIGALDAEDLELMRDKIVAFYSRRVSK
jgi:hypothetical protein